MNFKNEYDLIVSLGANCMVANNLRYRDMRNFSLPFDWVCMKDEKPLKYLSEGFKNKFKNFLLKENLEKVLGNEEHKIIYKDLYTGFYFPNHFKEEILTIQEYLKVYNKLHSRVNRLFRYLDKSNSVLFILAGSLDFNEGDVLNLYEILNGMYPNKKLYFRIMQFSAKVNAEKKLNDNVVFYKYSREQNLYDFTKTNFEWAFLDEIKYTCVKSKSSKKILSFKFRNKRYQLDLSWRKID